MFQLPSPFPLATSVPAPAPAWPVIGTALVLGSAWAASRVLGVMASSRLGYWLGVAGGVAMLALFAYPLRKRLAAMRHLGPTRHWFVFHMAMGVAGPWLILVHCHFEVGSLNAAVALWSMLVVAASGVVGRYLYRHVHRGMDGRHAQLAQLRARLDAAHERLGTQLALAPQVRDRLYAFEAATLAPSAGGPLRLLQRSNREARAARREVRALIDRAIAEAPASLDAERRRKLRSHWRRHADHHVEQTLGVAQLRAWERLFALWHVLHLPFVYVMVACAVVHVVAVHAY
jgi:hypothetical protein